MEIKAIENYLRETVVNIIKEKWGSGIVVSRGKVHDMELSQGFVALEKNEITGLITYEIQNNECEIISLDSFNENKGVASELIKKVYEMAKENQCRRLWLITTNDNVRAIRFYQKRGFNMIALHVGAVDEARKLKPQIPVKGYDDIPIKHEIEFEKTM